MRSVARAIAALAILAGALGAVPAHAAQPLRLTVGTLGPIGSLDPRTGSSQVAHEVWNLQYPTMTSLDPQTLEPVPGLARGWSPAPHGRGWIYTLRLGLRWSDGRRVTARDVADSVARAKFGSARVLGDRVVEIDGPAAPGVLVNVTPAHVLRTVPNLDKNLTALGVADGTWHVTARTDDSVQLDATRPGGPPLQQIVFRTYPNADALITALDRGDVDVATGVPPSDAARLGASSNVTVDEAPDGTQYQLRDNLPDVRVRQAVSLAIDRTELVAQAVDGIGTPGVVPIVARGAVWGLDAATTQRLTASLDAQPDRARALLAAAGTPGRTLRLSAPGDPTSRNVARYLAGALESVGLHVETVDPARNDADLSLVRADATAAEPAATAPVTYPELVARTRADVAREAEQARLVGLFQPDALQGFRSDNVTGFLRSPEVPSLVVFAPTISQYSQLVKVQPPPGEQAGTLTYAVGAVAVVAVCGAALAVAAWIRRRFVA